MEMESYSMSTDETSLVPVLGDFLFNNGLVSVGSRDGD
jgi:hypothetical protein